MDVLDLDIDALGAALDAKTASASEVLEASLSRIEATEVLNDFLAVDAAGARAAAKASDERRARGSKLSPLDGVPVALKDNILVEGVRATAGSKILASYVPPYDATVTAKLKAAGAVIVGKTNLDEFAMGSSSEHSPWGPVRNPWDTSRVAGGSSGGSAVSVAARQVFGALGSDTGGSIRQPAALTGVCGLKPTYARVSRFGIVAYASSLDQVGPFGRTVRDVARMLQAIAGFDPQDSTSAEEPVPDYTASLGAGVRGLRIGLPKEYFIEGIDPEIEASVRAAARALEKDGAELREISLPHTKPALSTYYLIATAEASSNLARYDGVRYGERVPDKDLRRMIARTRHAGFGPEVRRRIMLGTYVLSAGYYEAYYARAQKVRTLIRRDFEAAFGDVDLILTPTSPVPAFPVGERTEDPLAMYLADVFTLAVNLAGVPGLSFPSGFTSSGLPIGTQLIGPWFSEPRILAAAAAAERALGASPRRPNV